MSNEDNPAVTVVQGLWPVPASTYASTDAPTIRDITGGYYTVDNTAPAGRSSSNRRMGLWTRGGHLKLHDPLVVNRDETLAADYGFLCAHDGMERLLFDGVDRYSHHRGYPGTYDVHTGKSLPPEEHKGSEAAARVLAQTICLLIDTLVQMPSDDLLRKVRLYANRAVVASGSK